MHNSADAQDLLADSRLACLNRQYDTALHLAKQGIELEPDNAEFYKTAGDAQLFLKHFDEAVIYFGKAEQLVGIDPDILARAAVIHGIQSNIRSGLERASQIKLLGS